MCITYSKTFLMLKVLNLWHWSLLLKKKIGTLNISGYKSSGNCPYITRLPCTSNLHDRRHEERKSNYRCGGKRFEKNSHTCTFFLGQRPHFAEYTHCTILRHLMTIFARGNNQFSMGTCWGFLRKRALSFANLWSLLTTDAGELTDYF